MNGSSEPTGWKFKIGQRVKVINRHNEFFGACGDIIARGQAAASAYMQWQGEIYTVNFGGLEGAFKADELKRACKKRGIDEANRKRERGRRMKEENGKDEPENCGNCIFGRPAEHQPGRVECWRYPPQMVFGGILQNMAGEQAPNFLGLRPIMTPDRWCGEWADTIDDGTFPALISPNG